MCIVHGLAFGIRGTFFFFFPPSRFRSVPPLKLCSAFGIIRIGKGEEGGRHLETGQELLSSDDIPVFFHLYFYLLCRGVLRGGHGQGGRGFAEGRRRRFWLYDTVWSTRYMTDYRTWSLASSSSLLFLPNLRFFS